LKYFTLAGKRRQFAPDIPHLPEPKTLPEDIFPKSDYFFDQLFYDLIYLLKLKD